jgi:hypothetical protein
VLPLERIEPFDRLLRPTVKGTFRALYFVEFEIAQLISEACQIAGEFRTPVEGH